MNRQTDALVRSALYWRPKRIDCLLFILCVAFSTGRSHRWGCRNADMFGWFWVPGDSHSRPAAYDDMFGGVYREKIMLCFPLLRRIHFTIQKQKYKRNEWRKKKEKNEKSLFSLYVCCILTRTIESNKRPCLVALPTTGSFALSYKL